MARTKRPPIKPIYSPNNNRKLSISSSSLSYLFEDWELITVVSSSIPTKHAPKNKTTYYVSIPDHSNKYPNPNSSNTTNFTFKPSPPWPPIVRNISLPDVIYYTVTRQYDDRKTVKHERKRGHFWNDRKYH